MGRRQGDAKEGGDLVRLTLVWYLISTWQCKPRNVTTREAQLLVFFTSIVFFGG